MRKPLLASALLAGVLAGCMTPPQPVEQPVQYIAQEQPKKVWMTTSSSPAPAVVYGPRLLGDTLFGRDEQGEWVWVPATDIQRVEVQRLNRTKTTLLAAGVLAAGLGIAFYLAGEGDSGPPVCPNVCYPEGNAHVPAGIQLRTVADLLGRFAGP